MSLLQLALLFHQNRSSWSRLAAVNRLRTHACATLATIKRNTNKFDEPCMIDISRCCYDEVAVRKLACVITDRDFVIESRNSFGRAFDWTAERLVRKVSGIEEFAQEFVRRVHDHLHLFEDHLLLAFQVFLLKTRVRHD